MTSLLLLVLPLLVLAPAGLLAHFAVPARYDGFTYGKQQAEDRVLVEAFLDPMCSDSASVWPGLKEALKKYKQLNFVLHPFALPYHHNSFLSVKALHIVHKLNASSTFSWLDVLFYHQGDFTTSATFKQTPAEVVQRLKNLFVSSLDTSERRFLAGFEDEAVEAAARTSFKYACSRAVTGTPSFLVNGVSLSNVDETWGLKEWSKILDPLR